MARTEPSTEASKRGAAHTADDGRPGIPSDVEFDHRRPDGPHAADHVIDRDPSDHDPDGDCAHDTSGHRADDSGGHSARVADRHAATDRHLDTRRSSGRRTGSERDGHRDSRHRSPEVNASGMTSAIAYDLPAA